jgi:hypothetical protein
MVITMEAAIGEGTPSPWSMGADCAAAAAVVRAELRPAGEAACVRIVREVRCGDAVLAERVVWSRTLAPHAGAALLEVMQSLGPGLLLASEAAAVLPPRHAEALLDKMVADELDERRIAEEEAAEEVERAALKARKTREIDVFFTGTKRTPVLEMRRGSRATFFDLGFGAEWERERFWDWLKWQTGRFEDIAADVATHGAEQVRQALLHEMLSTEQAVKKRGLGAGGRRPLIFWRGEA